jgi:hypothetical protein
MDVTDSYKSCRDKKKKRKKNSTRQQVQGSNSSNILEPTSQTYKLTKGTSLKIELCYV